MVAAFAAPAASPQSPPPTALDTPSPCKHHPQRSFCTTSRFPQPLERLRSAATAQEQFDLLLVGVFALVAMILVAVGLYGVTSYAVAQRTRELGIRLALGAQPGDVLRIVLGQGARLAAAGLAIGIVVSLALTRVMATLLFGVGARDPMTFVGVGGLLALVSVVACYIPARRAMRVDPVVALRL